MSKRSSYKIPDVVKAQMAALCASALVTVGVEVVEQAMANRSWQAWSGNAQNSFEAGISVLGRGFVPVNQSYGKEPSPLRGKLDFGQLGYLAYPLEGLSRSVIGSTELIGTLEDNLDRVFMSPIRHTSSLCVLRFGFPTEYSADYIDVDNHVNGLSSMHALAMMALRGLRVK